MMRKLSNTFWVALCVVALGVPAARAQQQQQPDQQQQTPDQQQSPGQPQQPPDQSGGPIPAYRSPLASEAGTDDTDTQGAPDTRPLSGAQDLSPMLLPTRSYWQPQVNVFATLDSNAGEIGGGSAWTGGAAVSGRIDIHRVSGISDLKLTYTGGGVFSGDSGVGNGIVQTLGFGDKFTFHRATLSIFDQLNYLPGSSFGYGGLGGLVPGGSTGLGSVFGPDQTILTGTGQTLENSFVTEFNLLLSARASLTLDGGVTSLHNFSSGLLNSTNPNGRIGYNYLVTRKDTVAVLYTYSGYTYSNSDQSFTTHTAQLSYGRVVTGKVAFQIAAGPQYIISNFPITVGGTTTGPVVSTTTTQINWSLNTALTYTAKRNSFGVAYYRGANNGSGVLAGSIGDTVSASFTRMSSRTFTSGIAGGYSRNQGVLEGATILTTQSFDNYYASASLSHPMGRTLGLTLSYSMQYQIPHTGICTTPPCGVNTITNLVAFGVGWHDRPLLF
jgi:hypothetical protein